MPRPHVPLARPGPRLLVALLAALATALLGLHGAQAATSAGAAAGPAATSAATRIMPLGDSITGSPGCWRALLWNQLQNAGYTNIDFVGTQPPQGCGVTYDGDNEGHGGALATNIVSQNELPGWLSATNPDIVIMHLGTNDVWSDIAPAQILAAYTTLVGQMRANNPRMKVLVAQIIPMNPSSCAECAQRVVALNAQIPAWAQSISTAQSPVSVVDQWTGFDDATDTVDGVHPNDSGNAKMAARWFTPLAALLSGTSATAGGVTTTGGTDPTGGTTTAGSTTTSGGVSGTVTSGGSTSSGTSSSGTTSSGTTGGTASGTTSGSTSSGATSSGTASGGASSGGTGSSGCTATLGVASAWQGGYQGTVTVTAAKAITSWTVGLTLGTGSTLTQVWNGTATGGGSTVTVANAAWNGALAAGAATSFGYLASLPSGTTTPTATVTCTAS